MKYAITGKYLGCAASTDLKLERSRPGADARATEVPGGEKRKKKVRRLNMKWTKKRAMKERCHNCSLMNSVKWFFPCSFILLHNIQAKGQLCLWTVSYWHGELRCISLAHLTALVLLCYAYVLVQNVHSQCHNEREHQTSISSGNIFLMSTQIRFQE